jgi:predicted Zn-dependent protease
MQDYFHALADAITARLQGQEIYTCTFRAEDSDFVRFNRSAVRQAGTVRQRALSLDLVEGQRHAGGSAALSGDLQQDAARVTRLLKGLREQLPFLPEDPYLLYATEVRSSTAAGRNELPERAAVVEAVLKAGRGHDLVGLYAAGGIYVGFANAFGQRNWFASHNFNFDWSFYRQGDKAVKTAYAGLRWDTGAFERQVDAAAAQLEALGRPPRTIPPGSYRVYLAPAAVADLLDTLAWGGFGLKAHRTRKTTLLKMTESGQRLHPEVTLRENTREGVAPNFDAAGFIKPDQVTLIHAGNLGDCLVSARSAREYGVPTNGAGSGEAPESMDMAAGRVPTQQVLTQLDTGVYVNNVWYLNYSDRGSARITGMARFATFWVEDGTIRAPLNVMRFDESIYRMFGDNLLGLTDERSFMLDGSTYRRRSTGSSRVPGALVRDFTFTL